MAQIKPDLGTDDGDDKSSDLLKLMQKLSKAKNSKEFMQIVEEMDKLQGIGIGQRQGR